MAVPEREIRDARAFLAQRVGLFSSLIGGSSAHRATGGRFELTAEDRERLAELFQDLPTDEIIGDDFDRLREGAPFNSRKLRALWAEYRELILRARVEGIERERR